MNRARVLAIGVLVALDLSGCAGTGPGIGGSPGALDADLLWFQSPLAPYGEWVSLPRYGTVWTPIGIPAGWRPYTLGRWVFTDYGWMWLSAEPWGWATYHYGRWTWDPFYGWIWVPDRLWAPAWVAWRYGDGWVGWAPLPPEAAWEGDTGLEWEGGALDQEVYRWTFARSRDFLGTSGPVSVVPASRNVSFLPVTREVTRYVPVGAHAAERGLTPSLLGSGPAAAVRAYRVRAASAPRQNRSDVVRGTSIEVYRPDTMPSAPAGERSLSRARAQQPDPRALYRREERERRRFEERMSQERSRLEREQQAELREPPAELSPDRLRRRHREEDKAQEELERRERETQLRRREWLRERSEGKPSR